MDGMLKALTNIKNIITNINNSDDSSDSDDDNIPLFKVTVAIDFGTDGVGIAYSYNGKVYPHTKFTAKPKSKILLNKDGQYKAFGKDAQTSYMNANYDESKDWLLFENFKMNLYDPSTALLNGIAIENIDIIVNNTCNKPQPGDDNKMNSNDNDIVINKINISDKLSAVNGTVYASELVFIQVFKYIHKQCINFLNDALIHANTNEIQWILTVPAIWNDTAKYKLKKWAKKAKLFISSNQCRIVYEPDAASLFIQHELLNKYVAKLKDININNDNDNDDDNQIAVDMNGNVSPLPAKFVGNISRFTNVVYEEKNNSIDNMTKFDKGEQYILIDGGGGTVDVACHEIVGEFGKQMGIKEILPPTGGPWGSVYIDQQYMRLLMNLFTKPWIDEYITHSPNGWTMVLDQFRTAKLKFFNNPKALAHEVKLCADFVQFLERKMEEKDGNDNTNGDMDVILEEEEDEDDVDDDDDDDYKEPESRLKKYIENIRVDFKSTKKQKTKTNMISLSLRRDGLILAVELWKSMFNAVINPIVKHCEQLLESDLLINVQYMCLVGGLSKSKYFRKRINKAFGMQSLYRLRIIIPSKPILAVVEGAAYLSITKNYIRSRVLNATYGIETDKSEVSARKSNVSDHHIDQFKYWNNQAKCFYVEKCFSIYAKKKQIITTNQIIEKSFKRIPANAKKLKIRIFYSVVSNPTVTTMATHLADLNITFQNKNTLEIIVEFHFYDTLINVYSYPKGQNNKKKKLKLNYAFADLE